MATTIRVAPFASADRAMQLNRTGARRAESRGTGDAMRRLRVAAFVLLVCGGAANLRAADGGNPSGIWTWIEDPQSISIEINELRLKRGEDGLTGSLFQYNTAFPTLPKAGQDQIRRNTTRRISEGTVQGDEITFKVARSFNGRQSVTTYTARFRGDLLTGQIEGNGKSREWKSQRVGRN
jgi:hypothetical protein